MPSVAAPASSRGTWPSLSGHTGHQHPFTLIPHTGTPGISWTDPLGKAPCLVQIPFSLALDLLDLVFAQGNLFLWSQGPVSLLKISHLPSSWSRVPTCFSELLYAKSYCLSGLACPTFRGNGMEKATPLCPCDIHQPAGGPASGH